MIDIEPSGDPVPVLLERRDRSPFDESVAAGLVGLTYLAKQAFEDRRRKQCLEFTHAILKIDPEHTEASSILASVRSDLDRDFANAKALAQDARSKSDRVLYSQAAAAFRKIVDAEPDNLEAQTLLHETVAAGYFCSSSIGHTGWSGRRIIRRSILIGSVACLILIAGFTLRSGVSSPVLAQLPATLPVTAMVAPVVDAELPAAENSISQLPAFVLLRPENPTPVLRTATLVQPPRPSVVAEVGSAAAPEIGDLAVNAAIPVEIYKGDEHLGSTPATIQLPEGSHTLEYRYQGLRQTQTHLITGQQTSTATISFLIKVQINARPWAQVLLEGARLTPLGQTPLGDVSVPIGSVLVFQNPGFPDKRYRVTARDASIQVTFP